MNRLHPDCARGEPPARRGSIAVIAMITILITMSIGLSLVRTALRSRDQSLRSQQHRQARWLVEAGIERAVAQRKQSEDYAGETWRLSADNIGGRHNGEVRIALESAGKNDNNLQLTVVADYPAGSEHRIRSRKVITISPQNTTER